jgi:hypothetical protein
MSFFDRLFGQNDDNPAAQRPRESRSSTPARSDDEIAVERYRYLLRTAPPETIEQVHRDAFSKLTPQQRDIMFEQLTANAPRGERPVANDAASLATAATRSELRSPGTMERSLSGGAQANALGGGQGMGFGGTFGSSMLGTVAGYVVASSLMSMFLPGPEMATDAGADTGADTGADQGADTGADASADAGGDFGGGDAGGDFGGGFGDFGDFGF